MTTPTADEVNRRIAEFCGYRFFETYADGTLYGVHESNVSDTGSGGHIIRDFAPDPVHDYMHDAAAAIGAAEKLCQEKRLDMQVQHPGVHRVPQWWALFVHLEKNADGTRNAAGHSEGKTCAEAISLAVFAVLESEQTKEDKP